MYLLGEASLFMYKYMFVYTVLLHTHTVSSID